MAQKGNYIWFSRAWWGLQELHWAFWDQCSCRLAKPKIMAEFQWSGWCEPPVTLDWDLLYLQMVRTLYCTCLVIHMMSLLKNHFTNSRFFEYFVFYAPTKHSITKLPIQPDSPWRALQLWFWSIFSSLALLGNAHNEPLCVSVSGQSYQRYPKVIERYCK